MTPVIKTIVKVLSKDKKGFEEFLSVKPDGTLGVRYDKMTIETNNYETMIYFSYKGEPVYEIKAPSVSKGDKLDLKFISGEHFLDITDAS